MATYPTLTSKANEPLTKKWKDTTLFTESEADYIRTRSRTSRFVNSWEVLYNSLSASDFSTLQTFFIARRGYAESFTWLEPITNESKTVRFLKDTFNAQQMSVGRWRVNFTLEEV